MYVGWWNYPRSIPWICSYWYAGFCKFFLGVDFTRPYDVLPWVALVTNLLSFAAPYVLYSFDPVFVWSGRDWRGVHLYTVGAIYLLMTIVVEMPVVYGCLKKSAKDRKYLIGAIVGSNVVTTLITAAAERILCWGKW